MRARILLPALLTAVFVTVTGCGSDDRSPSAADTAEAAPSKAAPASGGGGSKEGAVPGVLDFTATTVDGKPFDGESLAGRPTVLWFWAPWCPTCKGQAARTAEVAADHEGRVNVVGVAGLDGTAAMRDFVADTGTGAFPHLADERGDVWKRFGITEQSHYVILDKSGRTVYEGVLPGGEGLAGKLAGLTG
ncbi:redoxin domain-containing protein [Streptomyces sp. NPDC005931]|uniref:redoxin domain-containing protein n=1 Tax=Streptomyces sp. NPDC005931 TaxID=3364737 RepID=UPI0036A33B96